MDLWTLITTPVPHLHPAWVGACAVVALILVFTPVNLIVTLFHETGHALTSLVFAGGFSGINLHSSGSGLTGVYVTSRLGDIPVTAAGYLAPGLFGLLTSWAYASGHTTVVLACLALISAVVAIAAVNLFGFAMAVVLAGLAGWAIIGTGTFAQALIVLVLAWVLLLGGGAAAIDTVISVDDGEDHALLQELTWVPARLWGLVFVAMNAWCLYAGGRLLFTAN